jgi:hypothetical protein
MTEEEQLKLINERAGAHLEDWLNLLEQEEVTQDDLLASLYAAMIVASLYGYSLNSMIKDAQAAAEKLLEAVDEGVKGTRVCINKDEKGNCPLHNLHCQYPDCEK